MRYPITIFSLFLFFSTFAQLPTPCPSNTTPPADLCADACIYCNFNGITSSTAGYTGQTPQGFCGTIENEQWIGFIAGETGATFTAIPYDCINGDGVQLAVYPACQGQDPVFCNTGCGGCGSTPVSITINDMVVGQNYLLMIDGFAGDQCSFTIVASPPSAITPPFPNQPDTLYGKTEVCSGETVQYCIDSIVGAAAYTWVAPQGALVDGNPSPYSTTSPCVNITFGNASGPICVNGYNSCYTGPPLCKPLTNQPATTTIEYPDTVVCVENLPYTLPWGVVVGNSGTYSNGGLSCDTAYQQNLFIPNSMPTVLPPVTLCEGDTVYICGQPLYQGQMPVMIECKDQYGCDSMLQFSVITPTLSVEINGGDTLQTSAFPITLSTMPTAAAYVWYQNSISDTLGTGASISINQAGIYIIEGVFQVGNSFCSAFDTIVVLQNVGLFDGFENEGLFTVTPSIGEGQFTVSALGGISFEHIQVYGMDGKFQQRFDFEKTTQFAFDLSHLQSGQYLLLVQSKNKTEVLKIVRY